MFRYRLIMVIVILLVSTLILAQNQLPDPVQVHHLVKLTSETRAGDIHWIETWESLAGLDRELVMIDAQGYSDGIQYSCYHALSVGGGTPLYMVDDEYIPVDSANTMWQEMKNRRIIDQSELYVAGQKCEPEGTESINGFQTEKCTFKNEDAANLFLIKPPATSQGELWTAIDGRFPVQYTFTADGSTGTVEHSYNLIQPPADFSIQQPDNVDLMCFDKGFPIAPETLITSSGLSYTVLESELSQSELQIFFDEQLIPDWSPTENLGNGGRSYKRTLDNGSECSMSIRFGAGRNDTALVSVDVYPQFVNIASFNLPDDFTVPVVVQDASNVSMTIEGTVQNALNQLLPSLEAEGWRQRVELSDIREDSAFVTLSQNEYDMHIIADAHPANTTVRIQSRAAICGPVFETLSIQER